MCRDKMDNLASLPNLVLFAVTDVLATRLQQTAPRHRPRHAREEANRAADYAANHSNDCGSAQSRSASR